MTPFISLGGMKTLSFHPIDPQEAVASAVCAHDALNQLTHMDGRAAGRGTASAQTWQPTDFRRASLTCLRRARPDRVKRRERTGPMRTWTSSAREHRLSGRSSPRQTANRDHRSRASRFRRKRLTLGYRCRTCLCALQLTAPGAVRRFRRLPSPLFRHARVAELVDALVSGTSG